MAAHCLPGRIRIDIPGMKGRCDRAAQFESAVRRMKGVIAVTANPVTGRALIYYEATLEVAATVEAIRPLHQVAGLSTAEASRRLRAEGPNTLKSKAPPSFISRLTDQFKDPMVATLLGGAGLSLLVGRVRDALTITAIVLLNAFVGASQAGKAEGALDALRRMAAPRATAVRDGRPVAIPAAEVVPGDLLLLEAGDKIPADARISVAFAAQTDESMLTGESLPVAKAAGDTLFAGTTLTGGRCSALVTGTGMRTEMGRIARLLGETQEGPTPLQTRMEELGKTLVRGSLWVCAGVVVAGLLRRLPAVEMFLTGVSLAVAAIPEGLPTFVTLGLATGVRQMARRKALVRRLQAVETLGNATYICTDKTGTLTANAMTVRQIYVGERWFDVTGHGFDPSGAFHCDGQAVTQPLKDPDLARILNVGAICNNASLRQENGAWSIRGDATEGALLVAAAKAGLDPVRHCRGYRRMLEVPFDSGRRRMTVVCEGPKGTSIYTKGAPEAVLAVCTHALRDGRVIALTEARRRQILNAADAMAGRAYRVLATATRPLQDGQMPANVEHQLIFLGLLGLMDPPRPEVPPALERCRRAGIKVLMLTGDHPRTAEAVAREIGLLGPGDLIMTGDEIAALDDAALGRCVERLRVGARVSPEQKLRVVRALRKKGHVVAMTGDGVNDAPAVKEADIGIAMGLSGTDVTKEAAALILADDNFATIVAAVEQGRVTYNNIRRSIRYLLASNLGEVILMVAAVFLGLPLPLIPLQILWLNLVGDGLPALALGAEPADGSEMHRPPRPRQESIFAGGLGSRIVRHGARMGVAALGLYLWALRSGRALPVVRTLTLCGLVLGQLIYLYRCRGRDRKNPLVTWAVVASLGMLAASVLFAPLRTMLQLTPLGLRDWTAAGVAAGLGAL